jgi:capsular polysaccharide biosynthesis protein
MIEDKESQIASRRIGPYEDEIELIDILRVIWKWKYFILIGTLVCGVLVAIISLSMERIYSIDMVLRPGILRIDENEKKIYLDSAQNIKALIESGTFDNDILDFLKNSNSDNIPKNLRFKVTIPKNSDAIKIQYETSHVEQGIELQNNLRKLLLENYRNKLEYYKREYDMKLNSAKSELESIKKTILSYKRNVKNIEKRISELTSEIELIKNNTSNLIKERNKLLSKSLKENNVLFALLYSNTIQQNLELSNNYQNEINENKIKKEIELQRIEKSENIIAQKLNTIVDFQFKRDNIQNIQFLRPASRGLLPIKPKTALNTILAIIAGAFFFLFLSFFLEYLKRQKKDRKDN